MADNDHLKQELERRTQRWKTLLDKYQAVQEQYDLETHADEKFRLKKQLESIQPELTGAEADVTAAEQALHAHALQDKLQPLRVELAKLRRNKAYQPAIKVAREIQSLLPTDPQIADEIAELQKWQEQGEDAQRVFAQLTAHFTELSSIVKTLAHVLTPRNEHPQMLTVTTMAQHFLDQRLKAEDFISICQSLFSAPVTHNHQYAQIADKIRKGRTVLFLGSAIPNLYAEAAADEQVLAGKLAEEIRYQNFSGSLSSIAEYYLLTPGYGRPSLLENLQKLLPQELPSLQLYASLARTPANLILISATYDTLLENAFRAVGKPFVEIASIIIPNDGYKLGSVVLTYSDREGEYLYAQEDLSTLGLLKDYSIIYKIRGSCDERSSDSSLPWRDAITLTESNYFAFAEHASKIIPDYLIRELRDREFLFIGFSPARWEDRLLAHALLLKRPAYSELCYTIGKASDPLQAAFWDNRNVRQSDMDFAELDRYLQEATQ